MNLYLELLKRCVANTIYSDDADLMRGKFVLDADHLHTLSDSLKEREIRTPDKAKGMSAALRS